MSLLSGSGAARPGGGPAPFDSGLSALFARLGAVLVETPLLQRAEPYLDTAGEDLRRRIFLTRGEGGETLCLRPDFTIPVCLAHIEGAAGLPRRYAYNGPVFRQRRDEAAEFRQAGIENLGETDRAAADARALAEALAALRACGFEAPVEVVVGDQALFEAFLTALDLPAGWQRRLVRCFGRDDLLRGALAALSREATSDPLDLDPTVRALVRDGAVAPLSDHVRTMMEEGGLPPNRGRSPDEIAERLIEKMALASTRLRSAYLDRLGAFLALDCPLAEAPARLEALEASSGVEFGAALALLRARNAALLASGVDLAPFRYRAAFGRPIDYYTGLVFEIGAATGEPLVAGGRYDRLVSYLGAPEPIPAVGFSLWLDRIAAALEPKP
ncbi:ATP phosphoribosyltransferase regulatory subunit [Aureimonas flava]|uniref:Histidine--tRNA ligase n=1 Tax=Aureimonas flava TaxID=2320271 RepID=A0A3A1WGQ6_9HYPH|nr:ATP phosphoribosyltransferase regulatory subunit [Aureimonas flava]RIX99576.1 ATP phosphoribosyltransferase regulatory subunit [Aureimonas flava]